MKKILLLAIVFLGFSATGFSQLSIQDTSGATLTNGDTLTVTGTAGYQLSSRTFIYNGTLAIPVEAICIPTNVAISGCTYSICVGPTCYKTVAVNTNFTSPSFTIPKGKDSNAFYQDYNATNAGTTIIMYEIKNKTGTDSTWFFVKFIANPVGIATIAANNLHISALYPNPANSVASFAYHTDYDARLSIYNSLGQVVKAMPLSANKENISINTADMPSGVYICKIVASGTETAYRRLVVSH
jgi:hypothetical protein